MNTAIESTDKLVKQLDGKVAPGLQATLDDVRKTVDLPSLFCRAMRRYNKTYVKHCNK